jgi:adenylate cyclase class IV
MARNVEIKARVADLGALRRRVESLTGDEPEVIDQHDTFFHVAHGRLKLRRIPGASAELIAYERPDRAAARRSTYEIVPVADPDRLERALAAALGVAGTVQKRRLLYRSGRTRIHLDRVFGLGTFLELEVVLGAGTGAGEGDRDGDDHEGDAREGDHHDGDDRVDHDDVVAVEEAHRLMDRLGIDRADLVASAYVDLLAGRVPGATSA